MIVVHHVLLSDNAKLKFSKQLHGLQQLGKKFQKRLLGILLHGVTLCNKLLNMTNLSWMTNLLNSSKSSQR